MQLQQFSRRFRRPATDGTCVVPHSVHVTHLATRALLLPVRRCGTTYLEQSRCDRLMSWRLPTKRTRTHLGDRSFSVAGPCLWNSILLHYMTEISYLYSLRDFWRQWVGLRRIVTVAFFAPCTNIFTYLLTYLDISYGHFKRQLTTFLFATISHCDGSLICAVEILLLTYLLTSRRPSDAKFTDSFNTT